jgi:serine/threonine protein kinase
MSGEQLEPGTLLNERYRILRVIGKGGMGTVYQAEHIRLDTILAVKEVRAPQTEEDDAQALLKQCEHEARFLVKLHHPNLPQVTDAFLENDRFFIVMEFIDGVTLDTWQRRAGPEGIPVRTIIEWALQIADVLAYLHTQDPPIIFRDLKPANVMVEPSGRIRLIDFGIARRFQPGAVKDTNLLGSVGYSPPEQFGRHQTDTRTDIYSFGATLHNLLTGKDPSHAPFKFASVRSINPAVPESLSLLIDFCLRLDADARPQSVREIALDLLTIRDTLPAPVDPPADHSVAVVDPVQSAAVHTSPNIILTNTTLRNTGKTQRGSQRTNSGSTGSDRFVPGTARTPSGAVAANGAGAASASLAAEGSAPGRMRLWFAGIAAFVVVGGLTGWMINAGAKRPAVVPKQPLNSLQTPAAPDPDNDPGPGKSNPPIVSPGGVPPVIPSDTGSAPMATLTRTAAFDAVTVKDVAQDSQGRSSLRIQVTGSVEGQTGDQVTIAAFFYDPQNNQLLSQLPQTPYSSKDGKLSVATTLGLTATHMPFDLMLDIPLAAFPANLTGGVQFHCVAFYGDQRIGETKTYTPIAAGALVPSAGSPQNTGVPPPDNGSGTPANPPSKPSEPEVGNPTGAAPKRPGTISSSPVHFE